MFPFHEFAAAERRTLSPELNFFVTGHGVETSVTG